MLALGPSTADLIRAVTGSAADVEVTVSYVTYSNATPPVVQLVDGEPLASITTATSTTLLAGASATYTVIKGLNCYNRSATQTTLRLEHEDGGTHTVGLINCTLLQDEALVFTESGLWVHYDANGAAYPSVGNAATQAEMEAGTATDKYVSPGRQHFHPGMAKFVCMTTGAGTPVMQTPPSYNMTSITDAGAGRLTVTIATDFVSANWCCLCTNEGESTTLTEIGLVNTSYIRTSTIAAGSVEVNSRDGTGTTNALNDPPTWHVAGFGDHA